MLNPVLVVLDRQARPWGNRHATIVREIFRLVAIVLVLNLRNHIRHVRPCRTVKTKPLMIAATLLARI